MTEIREYRRDRAVLYAERYAFSQNPLFGDFRDIGGNCTNFVSQCLYAGSCRMNFQATFGWYYRSMNDRAPAWTGVEPFYRFLTENRGDGPFGKEIAEEDALVGDVIQLFREDRGFYHSLLIVGFGEERDPLVAAQTDDALRRPLSTYEYDAARFLHIDGVRSTPPTASDCFLSVYDGAALVFGGFSGDYRAFSG